MKKILPFLFITFFVLNGFSQDIPFPTDEDVLNDLKSNTSLKADLKKVYNINSIDGLSIEKDYRGYATYYSSEIKKHSWRLSRDRCYIVYYITSKPNEENIYYKVPISFNYSRLKKYQGELYLADKWDYLGYSLKPPTIYGAKKITNEIKSASICSALSKAFESNFNTDSAGFYFALGDFYKCIRVESIYPEVGREDFIKSPTEQYWEMTLKGDFATFEEGAKIETLGENLEINFDCEVELVNKEWVVKHITFRSGPYEEEYEGDDLYRTYKEVGLNRIYKKRTAKAIPKKTRVYLDLYANEFEKAVNSFTENEELDLKKIAYFIENENLEIAKSIRDFYLELKRKIVSYDKDRSSFDIVSYYKDEVACELDMDLLLKRPGCSDDKTLCKKYLEAGMSKKVLKSGKWFRWFSPEFNLIFRDDKWLITNKLEKDFEIPFN